MDTQRAGDADRDAAIGALAEHYAAGRMSKEEFDERSDAAWSARTHGDLRVLFADLPVPAGPVGRPQRAAVLGRRSGPRFAPPFLIVLAGLIALSALTHLPFVVFGLLAWFLLARGRGCRTATSHPRR